MNLKALANKVLERDNAGTKCGIERQNLSQTPLSLGRSDGTVIYLPPELIEAYEERAAIMEHDAGLSRENAQAAALNDITKGQK